METRNTETKETQNKKEGNMAKYTINHSCGHEEIKQLYGKHSERERKIEWMESEPCWECQKKENYEHAKKQNTGLVALEGSEKQIAWAETIRNGKLSNLDMQRALIRFDIMIPSDREIRKELMKKIENMGGEKVGTTAEENVKKQQSAHWWIENRNADAEDLVARELARMLNVDYA